MSKTCTKCGETKPLDGFRRKKGGVDGRDSRCKECRLEYERRYREENLEKMRERERRYREENREKVLERQRRWREENREKVLERQRRHRKENREKVREYQRRYHEENRDKMLDYKRRYYEENRDEWREHQRLYYEENRDILKQRTNMHQAQNTRTSNLLASKKGVPYSPEEDALILADNGMTIYQKAIELGRTYLSVTGRKHRLHARANH